MSYRLPWQSQKEQIHKRLIALTAAKNNISMKAMLERPCLSCLVCLSCHRSGPEERKQANGHFRLQAQAEPFFRRLYALLSEAHNYPFTSWETTPQHTVSLLLQAGPRSSSNPAPIELYCSRRELQDLCRIHRQEAKPLYAVPESTAQWGAFVVRLLEASTARFVATSLASVLAWGVLPPAAAGCSGLFPAQENHPSLTDKAGGFPLTADPPASKL